MNAEERVPTTKRLADALRAADAPASMIRAAEDGAYDEFKSGSEQPIVNLVHQCLAAGLDDIAQRAIDGEFDLQDWEVEDWAQHTSEGKAVIQEFFGSDVDVGDLFRRAVPAATTRSPIFRRRKRR